MAFFLSKSTKIAMKGQRSKPNAASFIWIIEPQMISYKNV